MKKWKRLLVSLLTVSMTLGASTMSVMADDTTPYTYKVTLSAGNKGTINGQNKIEQTNIASGSTVTFNLNDIQVTDDKYYVKGIRLSGRDNNETLAAPSFTVDKDADYVVAYGIKGNMVAYTAPEYQKDKLESLIAEFRLQKVRKNLGDQLSGGERRRTEIARCLAIDPKFIMLDEPFAGVDPIAVEDIQHIVWKLKDKNIGILITDHNALETLRLTDRAYLLFEGKILFQGTPEELAENPVVREKYLGTNFVLRRKDFQLAEKDRQEKKA